MLPHVCIRTEPQVENAQLVVDNLATAVLLFDSSLRLRAGQTITTKDEIKGRFRFEFKANVFNASKQALQQSLQALLSTYVSELAFQLGLITPSGAYRLMANMLSLRPDRAA